MSPKLNNLFTPSLHSHHGGCLRSAFARELQPGHPAAISSPAIGFDAKFRLYSLVRRDTHDLCTECDVIHSTKVFEVEEEVVLSLCMMAQATIETLSLYVPGPNMKFKLPRYDFGALLSAGRALFHALTKEQIPNHVTPVSVPSPL